MINDYLEQPTLTLLHAFTFYSVAVRLASGENDSASFQRMCEFTLSTEFHNLNVCYMTKKIIPIESVRIVYNFQWSNNCAQFVQITIYRFTGTSKTIYNANQKLSVKHNND